MLQPVFLEVLAHGQNHNLAGCHWIRWDLSRVVLCVTVAVPQAKLRKPVTVISVTALLLGGDLM